MSMHRYRSACRLTTLFAVFVLPAAGRYAAAAEQAWRHDWSPVWMDLQGGINVLQRGAARMQDFDQANPYWKWELGVHPLRDWLFGVGRQKVILSSYDCSAEEATIGCADFAENFSRLYATALFNPHRGHWLVQAGLGSAKYRSGYAGGSPFNESRSGWGANFGVGFDWSPVGDLHLGMRASYEYSRFGAHGSGPDSLSHSSGGLAFCISWY